MNTRLTIMTMLLALGSVHCGGEPGQTPEMDEENLTFSISEALTAPVNLALFKPTSQTSTAYGGDSSRAVDGNKSGDWGTGSVTHTNYDEPGVWQVDLESIQPVGEIVIHKRTDCCGERFHDFTVKVSTDGANWTDFVQPGVAKRETHIAVDRQARYVRIDNPDSLQLAEVEVFRTKNLAYNKPATQSSTDFGGDAWKAVDGNTDGNYGGGSVSHTGWENGWWQVDLQALKNIGYVVVHNRTDCNGHYLHDFTVKVSNDGQNWYSIGFQGPASAQVLVPVNREARYVRIENAVGYLHMAEVQVFEAQHVPGWAYGRGAGTVPNWHCADGLEYQAGLCYDPCQYDYDGVGFVCWQKCAPDYMDFGATCTNWSTWHTYGKNTYTRAVHGLTATCASDEDLDAGLCYPKCDPGFHGVGPVCWADQIDIQSIAQSTCEAFRVPVVAKLAMQSGKTLTAGVGASVSLVAQGTAEVGVAYGSNGEYGCYVTACGGISLNVSINAYASLGTYNSFSSIAGDSTVISTGYSQGIPATPISIGGGMGFVLNTQGEQIGTTISGNVGVGFDGLTPIDFSTLTCHTEVLQTR